MDLFFIHLEYVVDYHGNRIADNNVRTAEQVTEKKEQGSNFLAPVVFKGHHFI